MKILSLLNKKRVFLDYASTTPVLPEVLSAMKPFWNNKFANSSSLYAEAVVAKKAIENSRTDVARVLGARAQEIYFTGSGTESNNLAILGLFEFYRNKFVPHIITTTIEHPAVLEVCREIERRGGDVTYVSPEANGIVSAKDIFSKITERTILVTVMMANNEIGTVQPIALIARLIKKRREEKNTILPLIHTDACQAGNYLSLLVSTSGVDMLTLDGGKIYGPKGVGMLFVKKEIQINPIVWGGGQERGLRSGTENVSGIVGFAKALTIANRDRSAESARLSVFRDFLVKEILAISPNITLNGDSVMRLPNNINVCLPGMLGEFVVIKMDTLGVAISSGSACGTLSDTGASHVLKAIGKEECASSSIRITLGKYTTKKDLVFFLDCLKRIIAK